MKEYIEKETARAELIFNDELYAADIVKAIPAADVVEVRRAAWQSWEQDKPPCKWYSCDYCGFHALSRSNHCPNCGADMRGERRTMRLIDADALKTTMDQCIFSDRDRFSTGYAKEFIDHAPTINAVLVVFCRECRHRDPEDHKCDCGAMERQGCPFPVDDDYFCKYGERKGGASDGVSVLRMRA